MPSAEPSYRAIVDTVIDAIIVIDEWGSIQAVNPAAVSIFGYAATDLVGKNIKLLMEGDHARQHDAYLGAYRSSGDKKIIGIGRKVQGRRRNGEVFPLELSVGEWKDESGKRFFTGIIRDISERERIAAALHENQEWLRTVTDTAFVGLVVVDEKHRIRFANDAYAIILHRQASDLIGVHISEVLPDIYEAPVKCRLQNALAGVRASYVSKYPPNVPLEEQRTLVVTYAPSQNLSGDPIVVIIVTDISELSRTEMALRESRDLLRSVLDGTLDPIFAKDLEGRYLVINEQSARTIGRPAEEIVGKTDGDIWPSDLATQFVNHDLSVMAENKTAVVEQSVMLAGRPRHFRVTKQPWRNAHGEIRGVVGISRDITSERQAEEERDDLIRRLIAAEEEERLRISRELHDELGQEVTGLSLGLKRLEHLITDGEARSQLSWLRSLTDQISRSLHSVAVELRPASLRDLGLAQAISSHASAWSERFGIKCDFHIESIENIRLHEDVALVAYRCIQEALTNVLKHAKAQNVSIVAQRTENDLRLIIEDDGVGFEPEAVAWTKGGRRGLGLAGMQERLALVGGSFAIESQPGQGSAMFINLPWLEAVGKS